MGRTAYIGVGSNMGDRLGNFRKAITLISELPDTRITGQSSLYETEPHGRARNWFLNGVISIETEMDATDLLKALQKIETAVGRKRDKSKTNVSRVMDLDILLYEAEIFEQRRRYSWPAKTIKKSISSSSRRRQTPVRRALPLKLHGPVAPGGAME
jgi:2-amino-4-hydroxy-6-hydroxymethyldihydropteridine diphosphokinase